LETFFGTRARKKAIGSSKFVRSFVRKYLRIFNCYGRIEVCHQPACYSQEWIYVVQGSTHLRFQGLMQVWPLFIHSSENRESTLPKVFVFCQHDCFKSTKEI